MRVILAYLGFISSEPIRDNIVFFFNDTATTEIYTLSPTRRSSDLEVELEMLHHTRRRLADAGYTAYEISKIGSTRLNSSHANISYAVFCLKKIHSHQYLRSPLFL